MGFIKNLETMIDKGYEEIYINWINIPEYCECDYEED